MSRHDDRVYLLHIRDHARTAMDLAEGKVREDLDREPVLRYALLHLICILGEAANRVSANGKATLTVIPWRNLISTRNALIHGYDSVDLDRPWDTITAEIPVLAELWPKFSVLKHVASEPNSGL